SLPAGRRRDDRDVVAVAEGSVETGPEANILAANVYVNEAANRPVIFAEPGLELGERGDELLQAVAHRCRLGRDFALAICHPAQRRRNLHCRSHFSPHVEAGDWGPGTGVGDLVPSVMSLTCLIARP